MADRSRHTTVEVTCLRTRAQSYKIFRRGFSGREPPVAAGIATLAEAKATMQRLDKEAEVAELATIAKMSRTS